MMDIPVFYKVYPSDVRHQKGTYGEALAKHKIRFPDKLQNWEMALRQVADLSGFHFKYRYPMIPIFLCFNFYWIKFYLSHNLMFKFEEKINVLTFVNTRITYQGMHAF